MTELSPAASAVLQAITEISPAPADEIAAAALRATAVYAKAGAYGSAPSTDWGDGWKEGVQNTAQGLLAIADELETSN